MPNTMREGILGVTGRKPLGCVLLDLITLVLLGLALIGCASNEERVRKSTTHYEYGVVYLNAGDPFQAFVEFEKAKEANPKNDRALFGIGLTLYLQGKFDQAVNYYKRAIEINPNVPEYHNNMAACLAKLGRWEEVITYSQNALDNPSYPTPGFAYYNMGSAYINMGETRKGMEFLLKAKQENPEFIDTHLQLGKALYMLGEFQNAREALKEAKDLLLKSGAANVALEAEIDYMIGQSCAGLGDTQGANAAFRSVIEKAPLSPFAKDAAKQLMQ